MINLLPPKIKHEQKIGQISSQINAAVFALIIMVALTYSAIFLVNFFLSGQLGKIQDNLDKTNVEIAKLKDIESSVTGTNQKLSKLDTYKDQRFEWSSVFVDINNSIPEKVKIDSIQIDQKGSKFVISAAAETRSDIVKLQAKLEDLDYLKNLSFQSSTYNEKESYYTFSMVGTISK